MVGIEVVMYILKERKKKKYEIKNKNKNKILLL